MDNKPFPDANPLGMLGFAELKILQRQINQRLVELQCELPRKPVPPATVIQTILTPRTIPVAKYAPPQPRLPPRRVIPVASGVNRMLPARKLTPSQAPLAHIMQPAPSSEAIAVNVHPADRSNSSSLRSIEPGQHFEGFYTVRKAVRQKRRDGVHFWKITLGDATGWLVCYAWPESVPVPEDVCEGAEVFVEVRARLYKNHLVADILALDLDVPPA